MASKASKTKKKQSPMDESDKFTKKSPMKTASDVISRLLWDESLPEEKFTVGYLDRFTGIIEQSFTSLDWNHPSIVDNYSLALPKHRICYFKYRNRKVWDKTKRLDIVFGSTGSSSLDIYQFMQQVDTEKKEFVEENADSSDSNHTNSDDDDNDKTYDISGRPNYFIAVRISNSETIKNLKVVSDYIKEQDPVLSDCCIPVEKYHLTLSILKVDSPEELSTVISVMKNVAEKKLPVKPLVLDSLDDFHQRVLFSKVDSNSELLNLRNILIEELTEKKLTVTDRFSFVPHVTVAKLSRTVSKMRHSRYIDQYLYLKFEDDYFGTQEVKSLCLCEMGSLIREDGFYSCAAEISLT